MWFDTHSHLNFKLFSADVAQVIERSRLAGVTRMMVVGTNIENSRRAIAISQGHEGVWASVGLHPLHVFGLMNQGKKLKAALDDLEQSLTELLSSPEVLAVGESGLDRHVYQKSSYKNYQVTAELMRWQKAAFELQWHLAAEFSKTLIIHNREAADETAEKVQQLFATGSRPAQVVLHCCEPSPKLLDLAIEHRFFVGVAGDVTSDQTKAEFVKRIPLDLLVLETDAPYFKPKSKSQTDQELFSRCEPADLALVAKFVSRLRNLDQEKLSKQLFANSDRLFFSK